MKKLLLFCSSLFIATGLSAQTTATDFTCNDCTGNNHNLFSELDSGKVIVISFVMPCASCISPSFSAYKSVQNYQSSNPGRVFFYIIDDLGNDSCSTLNTWATTDSMYNAIIFSDSTIHESDYGNLGMPKILVLGGSNHHIYYNVNFTINKATFQKAIDSALLATTQIAEPENYISRFTLFPNPAAAFTEVSYSLESATEVNCSIYNLVGENVKAFFSCTESAGEHSLSIDCSTLNNGLYFVKLIAGRTEKTIKLSVSR